VTPPSTGRFRDFRPDRAKASGFRCSWTCGFGNAGPSGPRGSAAAAAGEGLVVGVALLAAGEGGGGDGRIGGDDDAERLCGGVTGLVGEGDGEVGGAVTGGGSVAVNVRPTGGAYGIESATKALERVLQKEDNRKKLAGGLERRELFVWVDPPTVAASALSTFSEESA